MTNNTLTFNGMRMCSACGHVERTIVCLYGDMVEVTCDRCGSLSVHSTTIEGVVLGGLIGRDKRYTSV